jgi:hypothetical protein
MPDTTPGNGAAMCNAGLWMKMMMAISIMGESVHPLPVVPRPISSSANNSHLGAFHRTAPKPKKDAFWTPAAQAVMERIGPQPLALNTAGSDLIGTYAKTDKSHRQ